MSMAISERTVTCVSAIVRRAGLKSGGLFGTLFSSQQSIGEGSNWPLFVLSKVFSIFQKGRLGMIRDRREA